MRRLPVFALAVLAAAASLAQTPPSPVVAGQWVMKWNSARGIAREAHLDLTDAGGTFRMLTLAQRGRVDPCDAVTAPVRIDKAGAEQVVLAIRPSQALAGCADHRVTLRPASGGFTGEFGAGMQVTVTPR